MKLHLVIGAMALILLAGCEDAKPTPPSGGPANPTPPSAPVKKDDRALVNRKLSSSQRTVLEFKGKDSVVTIEGEKIEGKILKNDLTGIVMSHRTRGQVTIPATGIAKNGIQEGGSLQLEFMERLTKAEAGEGVSDLEALLRWTKDKDLKEHARLVGWTILKRELDNVNARQFLGFKRKGDSWVKR